MPYAQTLHDSLKRVSNSLPTLYVLVSSEQGKTKMVAKPIEGLNYLFINRVCGDGAGKIIREKYLGKDMDAFRWSMKPVVINYLLKEKGYQKVIFLDCDLFFVSDYTFLFDLLDSHTVLLSPHFRSFNPASDRNNYILQFTSGIYNGGFIAANSNATNAMDWLANVCGEICEKNPCEGQYVDQTHLNLLPVIFDDVYIIKHRGCNVANWNQSECRRVLMDDGEVRINALHQIIFIHFTGSTIRGIVNEDDGLLMPYLIEYNKLLKENGWPIDIIDAAKKQILKYKEQELLHKRAKNNSSFARLKKIVSKWLR